MSLENLPDDCILSILRFIPVEQLITLERVSSRWCRLSQESWKARQSLRFWSMLEKGWRRYGDVNFEPQCLIRDSLLRCGDYLVKISFADCPSFRMSRFTLEMIGQNCPGLEVLDLGGRILADSAVQGLLLMPKLRNLSLSKCFESGNLAYEARKNIDRALGDVLPKLPHLSALNMEGNRGIGTQGGKLWFGSLKVSSLNVIGTGLTPQQFQHFVTDHVGRIKEFRASECTFTCGSYWYSLNSSGRDVQMSQLAKSLVQMWREDLRQLEIREFTLCFEEEFKPAMKLIPNLTNLVELKLNNNKLINDDILTNICLQCTKLRTLSVASCPLTMRSLDHLRNLDDLRNLDVSKLKCIGDNLIVHLSLKMLLETISVRDCGARITRESLYALVLNCPCLSSIDVRGCKRITAEVMAEFRKCQSIQIFSSIPDSALVEEAKK